MRRRTGRAHAPLAAAALLVATACSGGGWNGGDDAGGDDPPDTPAEPDPSIETPTVTADPVAEGAAVALSWEAIDGMERYRVFAGNGGLDVPATICTPRCDLRLSQPFLDGADRVGVSSVTAGGGFSEPADVSFELDPLPSPEEPAEQAADVVIVRKGESTADTDWAPGPPSVETIPVSSPEEAETVIAQALMGADDHDVVAAHLSGPVEAQSRAVLAQEAGDDTSDGNWHFDGWHATWQIGAMALDQLPGDPRGQGVTIASIELGSVDTDHPALRGASIDQGAHMQDGSRSGVLEPDDHVSEPDDHATATASMIIGQPSGSVPGIAPGATLMPMALGQEGATDVHFIEAIVRAVDADVDIINISTVAGCGGSLDRSGCPQGYEAAIAYAEDNGVIVVAAAGNNGPGCADPPNTALMPAVLDHVISVGGYGPDGQREQCSTVRPDVDLSAPGGRLLVAQAGGGYAIESGTSFAAPLVSGLIAVILTQRPDLTPADVRAMLPQWQDADGRVSPRAALVTSGVLQNEDLVPVAGDDTVGIYPYEVAFVFDPPHPVAALLQDLVALRTTYFDETSMTGTNHYPWLSPMHWGNRYDGPPGFSEWERNYGVISGVVLLHDDGTATATGQLAFHRMMNSVTGPSSAYNLPSHGMRCRTASSVRHPSLKEFRWETPVLVEVTPVAPPAEGTDDPPPAVELTLSLGVGATPEAAGELPPMTVLRDNLDECQDLIEETHALNYAHPLGDAFAALDNLPTWEEQEVAFDQYVSLLEDVNQALVDGSPFVLEDPVILQGSSEMSGTGDDPGLTISYRTP